MPFPIQTQQEDQWCWAAIASSVDGYFSPFANTPQCRIAAAVLPSGGPDVCNDPEKYNDPAKLQDALKAIGRHRETRIGPLSFDDLRAEIDSGRPVCVRIAWSGGGAHFVVLSGYHESTTGVRTVDVSDPLYPNSTRLFEQFPSAYHGGGDWTATFFVNPAAVLKPESQSMPGDGQWR